MRRGSTGSSTATTEELQTRSPLMPTDSIVAPTPSAWPATPPLDTAAWRRINQIITRQRPEAPGRPLLRDGWTLHTGMPTYASTTSREWTAMLALCRVRMQLRVRSRQPETYNQQTLMPPTAQPNGTAERASWYQAHRVPHTRRSGAASERTAITLGRNAEAAD